MLLCVARDLRGIEVDHQDPEGHFLAAPMMLVLTLLMGSPDSKNPTGRTFSEKQVFEGLRIYQWAVEREIVTRLTGIGGDLDEEQLMSTLGANAFH